MMSCMSPNSLCDSDEMNWNGKCYLNKQWVSKRGMGTDCGMFIYQCFLPDVIITNDGRVSEEGCRESEGESC